MLLHGVLFFIFSKRRQKEKYTPEETPFYHRVKKAGPIKTAKNSRRSEIKRFVAPRLEHFVLLSVKLFSCAIKSAMRIFLVDCV
jgi:hypothetical protein